MIEYRTGDLFAQEDVDSIGHGVNCEGVMGSGIARPFRAKYPSMYDQYRKRCLRGAFFGGDVMPWFTDDLVIFNLATQEKQGADAHNYFIFGALQNAFQMCRQFGLESIAIPRIGAGIGGLTWPEVKDTFELANKSQRFHSTKVKLVVVTLPGQEDS